MDLLSFVNVWDECFVATVYNASGCRLVVSVHYWKTKSYIVNRQNS